ncbi:hypothetical protein MP228_006421 [Amoeboaphelidium protococcarum]|nr:hypothetical protein MP228_006421 [Amoeboaphelidium protococcarum]
MTSNNKSKISEAAQEVLNQFKQRVKHKRVSEFIQQCAATFAETDDKLIRELGVQSFLSLAPVFAPWYNDKSEQFGREVWGQNYLQAFNSTTELNCNDLSWQLPAQPPTDISLKPATELELNRSNMGNNVSEAKELQSYRAVCQQIQQLFDTKLRGDAPKREKMKERKQSKNRKKSKKLKLSAESLEAFQHQKARRGRQMNLNQIKELKQFEQKRVIKIRLFPDRKFVQIFNKMLQMKFFMVQYIARVLHERTDASEKLTLQALRNITALTKAKAKKREIAADDERRNWIMLPNAVQDEVIRSVHANYYAAYKQYQLGHIKDFEYKPQIDDPQFCQLKFLAQDARVDHETGRVRLLPSIFKSFGKLYAKDSLFPTTSKTDKWPNYIKFGFNRGAGFTIAKVGLKFFVHVYYDASDIQGPFTEGYYNTLMNASVSGDSYDGARKFLIRRYDRYKATGNVCSVDPGSRITLTIFDLARKSFIAIAPDFRSVSKLKEEKISLAQSFKDKLDNLSESLSSGCIDGHSFAIQKFVIWNDWKQSGCKVVPTAAGIRQAHRRFSAFVSNLHNRICNFLLRQYDLIILPEFQTSKMVRRKRKRLGLPRLVGDDIDEAQCGDKQSPPGITLHKTTRKNLLAFSHYKFRHKLVAMSQSDYHFMGKRVLITTEEFTSKQHPFKDVLHPKLGGERLFVLSDFSGLRDNVGAYNVMSRSFTKGEVIIDSGGGILHVQNQTLYKQHVKSFKDC